MLYRSQRGNFNLYLTCNTFSKHIFLEQLVALRLAEAHFTSFLQRSRNRYKIQILREESVKGTELVVLPPILVKRPFKVSLTPEFVLSSPQ